MANRFIYEQANGTVATNSTGEPVYKIQINADPNRATAYGWNFIMIANPFMAPIDFKKFYEANSSIIDKYCYIYNPEKPGSWDVIWNTSAISIIAPQQSFGVGFLYPNEASSAELVFNLNDVIVADNSIQPRLSAVELSKQQYQPVERGRIIRQHEVLTVFHATGKDLENVNAVNFVYASWEDNNPGTEESARQFEISPDTDSSQQIITYGTSPIIKYPISVTTGADNTTLVFEHTSSSVKSMNLTNKSSGETFNLFEHKNKNGLISLTVECRPNDNNLFELEITRN